MQAPPWYCPTPDSPLRRGLSPDSPLPTAVRFAVCGVYLQPAPFAVFTCRSTTGSMPRRLRRRRWPRVYRQSYPRRRHSLSPRRRCSTAPTSWRLRRALGRRCSPPLPPTQTATASATPQRQAGRRASPRQKAEACEAKEVTCRGRAVCGPCRRPRHRRRPPPTRALCGAEAETPRARRPHGARMGGRGEHHSAHTAGAGGTAAAAAVTRWPLCGGWRAGGLRHPPASHPHAARSLLPRGRRIEPQSCAHHTGRCCGARGSQRGAACGWRGRCRCHRCSRGRCCCCCCCRGGGGRACCRAICRAAERNRRIAQLSRGLA